MAAENDSGEKTEEPSGRRIDKARSDGMVGKSQDMALVAHVTVAFILLEHFAPTFWDKIQKLFIICFSYAPQDDPLAVDAIREKFLKLIILLGPELLLFMVLIAIAGSLTTAIQTRFLWSWKLVTPKFNQINPITGIKRLLGIRNWINILKSILKLAIIGPIAYFAFMDLFPHIIELMSSSTGSILPFVARGFSKIFWKIMALLFILSIFDFVWQKYTTKRDLKMTKHEVKEERKSMEGDEQTKMRIRIKGLQRIRQRMMQNVPTADVVVTNPTHFAVALKYDPALGSAPVVVAKGQDHLALRIREVARSHGVPVVEKKLLARSLYQSVEVGQSIPYELFTAVAELLAYVYRLRGKNPLANKKQNENKAAQASFNRVN